MKTNTSAKKLGIIILIAEAMLMCGSFIGMSYIEYAYTDLAHVDVGVMSAGMTIVSVANFVVSLLAGYIIQKGKSGKMGKFRRFLTIGVVMMVIGSVMMVFTFSDSMMVKAVVISIGYFLFNASNDFVYNSKYSLYGKMANGDSDALSRFNGMAYAGSNGGYIVLSLFFLTLVAVLGGSSEGKGFFLTQIVFSALVVVGLITLLRASRPYEGGENAAEEDESAELGMVEMLKGAFVNRAALAVFIAEIFKGFGYSLFNFMIIYQCSYVFGDINFMTIALTAMSVACMLGGFAAPKVSEWLGGRKHTTMITYAVAAVLLVLMAVFGQNEIPFLVFMCAALFIMSIGDSFEASLYLDSGEYWYHKTGNDTRPFVMSLTSIGAKIYYLFIPAVSGVVLGAAHYVEGELMVGADAVTMTRCLGLIPAACLVVFLVVMALFHKVSDKEIEVCIAENAKRDAAMGESAE